MKRLISAVLVLLALGVAAFFFLKLRPYLPEQLRGAELAPPETVLFVQFPNLRQTALRIPKTDLFQIWLEPDVQVFFEKPRGKAPWMSEWKKRIDEIARVAPGEVFVAFTALDGPRPSFVGGFSFAGSRRQAEELARNLREQLLPEGTVESAIRANWYLFASDAALLAPMMTRFDGPTTDTGLGAADIFKKTIAPLGVGQDLLLYGKPEALAGRLNVLAGLGGKTAPGALPALAMGTKIDGGKLRDAIFLPGATSAPRGALSRQTLPLASPETLLYYATDLAELPSISSPLPLAALLPGFAGIEKSLAQKGLSWSDLPGVVSPELGAMVEWPAEAALPTLLLASEIRDPAKARLFTDALTSPAVLGSAWLAETRTGITLLHAPPQAIAFISPTLALTDRFVLLGTTPETVEGVLPRTQFGSATLAQTPAFQAVIPLVPAEASAFGYLDFPRLFERVYRMARPFITLSLAFSAEAVTQFDAGKLPPVESIAKHLSASVIAQTHTEGGMLIESIGSLTIPQLLVGVSAGGLASGLPDLSGILPGASKRSGKRKTGPKPQVKPVPDAATPSPATVEKGRDR